MKKFLNIKSTALAMLLLGSMMYGCKDELDDDSFIGPSEAKSARPVKTVGIATPQADFFQNTTTWYADTIYVLQGNVRVPGGQTLTIQPGTVIKGDKASQGSLIIQRGGKIFAEGTKDSPIVFTSNEPVGSRNPGDWGGVAICGKAPNNDNASRQLEGFSAANAPVYGGVDPNDNSGVFRFVRIEYAGIPFTPDNEKNALTLGSVGKGTVLNHVLVVFSLDDGYEFFGGTVDARFMISAKTLDDDFDFDFGYTGRIQWGLVVRGPSQSDISKSNGIEADNNNIGPAYIGQLDPALKTNPILSNFTIIGPARLNNADISNCLFQAGFDARRNSAVNLYNSIIAGWPTGLLVENAPTQANFTGGQMRVKYTTIVVPFGAGATCGVTPAAVRTAGGADLATVTAEFNTPAYNNVIKTVGAGSNLAQTTGLLPSAWTLNEGFNPSVDGNTAAGQELVSFDVPGAGPANPNAVSYADLGPDSPVGFFQHRTVRGGKSLTDFDNGYKFSFSNPAIKSGTWIDLDPNNNIYE